MRLVIETWWNRVEDDPSSHWGTRVMSDFILKSRVSYAEGGGWASREEWKRNVKRQHKFAGFVDGDRAKILGGKGYGITDYQIVYLED